MSYPKVKSARAINNHTLLVEFDNQERKLYDIAPLLDSEMFAPLHNPAFFKNVQLEKSGYAIYWNDDIDLSEYELWSNGEPFASNKHQNPYLPSA